MHTKRADAPQTIPALPSRREFLRDVLASAALLALPSCVRGNGGPSIASLNNGREITLFLGSNALSQDALANMRNDVMNLRGLLEKIAGMARGVRGYRDFDFSGCDCIARTTLELVDDFMRESERPAPERMKYIGKRWEFVHMQLLSSIRGYRDGLGEVGMNTRTLGREFGVDLEDI